MGAIQESWSKPPHSSITWQQLKFQKSNRKRTGKRNRKIGKILKVKLFPSFKIREKLKNDFDKISHTSPMDLLKKYQKCEYDGLYKYVLWKQQIAMEQKKEHGRRIVISDVQAMKKKLKYAY